MSWVESGFMSCHLASGESSSAFDSPLFAFHCLFIRIRVLKKSRRRSRDSNTVNEMNQRKQRVQTAHDVEMSLSHNNGDTCTKSTECGDYELNEQYGKTSDVAERRCFEGESHHTAFCVGWNAQAMHVTAQIESRQVVKEPHQTQVKPGSQVSSSQRGSVFHENVFSTALHPLNRRMELEKAVGGCFTAYALRRQITCIIINERRSHQQCVDADSQNLPMACVVNTKRKSSSEKENNVLARYEGEPEIYRSTGGAGLLSKGNWIFNENDSSMKTCTALKPAVATYT